MKTQKNKANIPLNGRVEDAAKTLEQSKAGTGDGDNGQDNTGEQGGTKEEKPAGEEPGAGTASGEEPAKENNGGNEASGDEGGTNQGEEPQGGEDQGEEGKKGQGQDYNGTGDGDKAALYPVPTPEQSEEFSQLMADHQEIFQATKDAIVRTEVILAERNKGTKKTAEELASVTYGTLVEKYGKDFVTAQSGTNKTYFRRTTWNAMGVGHRGWKEVKDVMPEVAGK